VRAALGAGLRPILCVGETLEQREANRTEAVVSTQLALDLDGIIGREAGPLVIAYEPVWAIGTGRNATPAQAQDVHAFIRGHVANRFTEDLARAMRILYGGSVKAANAAELLAGADVDGVLVGGASLEAKGFAEIAKAAAAAARTKKQ
jgi:triosephosphate isomerase